MKRFISLLVVTLGALFVPMGAYANTEVRLVIDGTEVFDTAPIIVNDRTLVPVREIFERVGGVVGWHGGHRQVSLYYGEDVLVLTIDDESANLNGRALKMDVPPMIYNDRTMIPLRFPAEVFGFDVDWDENERAAIVNSPNGMGATNGVGTANNAEATNLDENEADKLDEPNEDEETITVGLIIPLPPEPEDDLQIEPEPESEGEYLSLGEALNEIIWDDTDELPPPGANSSHSHAESQGLAIDVSNSTLQAISFPETSITELRTPRETGAAAFMAVASSPISEVNYFLLPDNRLVVDIHNALSLVCGDYEAIENVPIRSFRAAQFSQTPKVARIVFDVIGAAEYSVSLSADRTMLTVSFSQNRIGGIFTQSDEFSDALFIQGDVLPAISVSTEGFPHYLTINIANAQMDAVGGMLNGVFASHYTTGQQGDSSYVNVYVNGEWPSFSIAYSANAAAFMLHRGVSGVRYDSVNRELRIAKEFEMDISQVPQINDYLRLGYTFVLPASAEALGRGEISTMDGFVNSISLSRVGENIHLSFNTARVLRFSIHEEAEYYVIRAHLPRDVSPYIVVIDPGHGGSAPGTSHHGVAEKDLVLQVAHMVVQLLDADSFITAFMTRREDVDVSLVGRAEFANNIGADLFVSIHANAAEIRKGVINPEVQGIETWYTVTEQEEASGFTSRQLAAILQQQMVQGTGAHDRGLRDAPNFVVLRETDMPAALLELGFLTNQAEAAKLSDIGYQWSLATAIYQGIVEGFAVRA